MSYIINLQSSNRDRHLYSSLVCRVSGEIKHTRNHHSRRCWLLTKWWITLLLLFEPAGNCFPFYLSSINHKSLSSGGFLQKYPQRLIAELLLLLYTTYTWRSSTTNDKFTFAYHVLLPARYSHKTNIIIKRIYIENNSDSSSAALELAIVVKCLLIVRVVQTQTNGIPGQTQLYEIKSTPDHPNMVENIIVDHLHHPPRVLLVGFVQGNSSRHLWRLYLPAVLFCVTTCRFKM